MFDVQIDESYIVEQSGTSEGTQIKYKMDDYWYKLDSRGREGCSKDIGLRWDECENVL